MRKIIAIVLCVLSMAACSTTKVALKYDKRAKVRTRTAAGCGGKGGEGRKFRRQARRTRDLAGLDPRNLRKSDQEPRIRSAGFASSCKPRSPMALHARGVENSSSAAAQLTGVIRKLDCNQVFRREANVEIEISVVDAGSIDIQTDVFDLEHRRVGRQPQYRNLRCGGGSARAHREDPARDDRQGARRSGVSARRCSSRMIGRSPLRVRRKRVQVPFREEPSRDAQCHCDSPRCVGRRPRECRRSHRRCDVLQRLRAHSGDRVPHGFARAARSARVLSVLCRFASTAPTN